MILLLIYVVFCKKRGSEMQLHLKTGRISVWNTSRPDGWSRLDPVERKDVIPVRSWRLSFLFLLLFFRKSSLFREPWEFNPLTHCVSELSWHDRVFLCDLSTQTHSARAQTLNTGTFHLARPHHDKCMKHCCVPRRLICSFLPPPFAFWDATHCHTLHFVLGLGFERLVPLGHGVDVRRCDGPGSDNQIRTAVDADGEGGKGGGRGFLLCSFA